jgi:hypothetical protein
MGAASLIALGIPSTTAYRVLSEPRRPRPATRNRLQTVAAAFARECLAARSLTLPRAHLQAIAAYVGEREHRGKCRRRCLWRGQPMPPSARADARYLSDACRQAARRARRGAEALDPIPGNPRTEYVMARQPLHPRMDDRASRASACSHALVACHGHDHARLSHNHQRPAFCCCVATNGFTSPEIESVHQGDCLPSRWISHPWLLSRHRSNCAPDSAHPERPQLAA